MAGVFQAVAREGFEPPNAMQADLQSAPFGRLGISPSRRAKKRTSKAYTRFARCVALLASPV